MDVGGNRPSDTKVEHQVTREGGVTSDTNDASGGDRGGRLGGDIGRRQSGETEWGDSVGRQCGETGGDQEEDDGDEEEVLPDGGHRRAGTPAERLSS